MPTDIKSVGVLLAGRFAKIPDETLAERAGWHKTAAFAMTPSPKVGSARLGVVPGTPALGGRRVGGVGGTFVKQRPLVTNDPSGLGSVPDGRTGAALTANGLGGIPDCNAGACSGGHSASGSYPHSRGWREPRKRGTSPQARRAESFPSLSVFFSMR